MYVGLTDEDLTKAKRDLIAGALFAKDGTMGPIQLFAEIASWMTALEIDEWPRHIRSVTKDQANEALKFIFTKLPISVLDLLPDSTAGA